MTNLRHQLLVNSALPATEHRIAMVQVEIPLEVQKPGGPPSRLYESKEYKTKIFKALSLALKDNWANIVVFPEISVPASWLVALMKVSGKMIKSRPSEAGGCLVCLPLEHLPLTSFSALIEKLSNTAGFVNGDPSVHAQNIVGNLLKPCPPAERATAFVNVAVLLGFDQSGSGNTCRYYFQPKLFPYPLERTPKVGRFLPANMTYIIEFGDTKIMTVICFDLIAQPPEKGFFFINSLLQEARTQFQGIDYLLAPQFNEKPLHNDFQRAVASLYHHSQAGNQTLRIVSPNVARFSVPNKSFLAGQSWFVTCPCGNPLPILGIWERNLVSVLKDPYSKEEIRDAPSLGHYAHRLRLSAAGEWLLNLSLPPAKFILASSGPNVPLIPHKGTVYGWRDSKWQPEEPDQFEHQCRYAERLPGLRILVEIPEWIQKNFGGKSTYSPSYAEFASRKVLLPKSDKDEILPYLKGTKDVLVVGEKGCGKTVFGLGIAFDWMAEGEGRCLFCDLKDRDSDARKFIDLAKDDIEWFSDTVAVPLLVILDNVHTEESIGKKLLEHVQKLRLQNKQIHTLLLGRKPAEETTERLTLRDNKLLQQLELIATEEAFQCVATRLSQRNGIMVEIAPDLAATWVKACGGDLAIFATAFDPAKPDKLDQNSISRMARERYIKPAEKQPGGLEAFLDLCLFSSLDLDLQDTFLWGKSAEAYFPEFMADGTVSRVPIRLGNPRSYCRLFHPSLGELILRVWVNFSELDFQRLWINRALNICYRQPFMLSQIIFRLATGNYGSSAIFTQWREKLNSTKDLVERAVCHAPWWTMLALRHRSIGWTWDRLKNLPEPEEGYHRLVESLARTMAGDVVTFLKYLANRGLEKEAKDLLKALLESEKFKQRLARMPADQVVTFLKYLVDCKLEKEGEDLLKALLENEEFKQRLARTPANFVVTFLKYLVNRGLEKEAKDLLKALLESEEFKQRLARTPADVVATFLKYLVDCKLEKEGEDLLKALLENEEFKQRLGRTPAGDIVTFLKYLDSQALKKERGDILTALLENEEFEKTLLYSPPDGLGYLLNYLTQALGTEKMQIFMNEIYGTLEPAKFEMQISQWPPEHLAGLQRQIRECRLFLPLELWRTLISVAYSLGRGEFLEPAPDPEYPQDKLLCLTMVELTALLKSFGGHGNRLKMNCVVKSLLSDEEKLQLWIKNLSVEDKALFRETVVKLFINIPHKSWELLDP